MGPLVQRVAGLEGSHELTQIRVGCVGSTARRCEGVIDALALVAGFPKACGHVGRAQPALRELRGVLLEQGALVAVLAQTLLHSFERENCLSYKGVGTRCVVGVDDQCCF